MTEQEYKAIDQVLDDAEDNVVPFMIPGDEITVVGDANETQRTSCDIEIQFRLPPEKRGAPYRFVKKTYTDVTITPRMDTKILRSATLLMPFFRKIKDDGTVTKYTDDEKAEIFASIGDEIFDAMYDTVALVLGIDAGLKDYMTPTSVIQGLEKIIKNFPGTFNEADTFFG